MLDLVKGVLSSDNLELDKYYETLRELDIPTYEKNGELRNKEDIAKDFILKVMELEEKKVNKYAFDILVYMFKDRQNKSYYSDVRLYLNKHNVSIDVAENEVRNSNEKELKDFIDILHEFCK